MTEEQANDMLDFLESINSHLERIADPTYDSSDVCDRLDTVISRLSDLESAVGNVEDAIDRMS